MQLQQVECLSESQVADLQALYQNEWWSQGRSRDDVRCMLENTSLIIGFVDGGGQLAAFCRVLTDFTFHAVVYDVIVEESYRGRGLGGRLMAALALHPQLRQVKGIWLCCLSELMPFYRKWGFESGVEGLNWMINVRSAAGTYPVEIP